MADRRTDRRARFRAAALTVFADGTYAATSVTDVCKCAGLSRRQFYEEFADREALLVAVYDEIQDTAHHAVAGALVEWTGSARELMATAITAYIDSVADDPRRAQVAFVEVVGVSEALEMHRRGRRLQWASTVEALVTTHFPDAAPPPAGWSLACVGFIGAVNGLVHEWISAGEGVTKTELTDLLTVILLGLVNVPSDLGTAPD